MHKFLSRPEHRADVSQIERLPHTVRSRVGRVAVEAPTSFAQIDALASYAEPASREIVMASPFRSCRGDTLPSQGAVALSRAAGFQGFRVP